MDKQYRILLADDHKLLMEGVRSLLMPYAHLRVCGMAVSGSAAVSLATSQNPHILLLDLNMPGMNGIDAGRAVAQLLPSTHIIIYTGDEEQRFLPELIDIGIMGYVRKSDNPQSLLKAIECVSRGEVYIGFSDPGHRVATLLQRSHHNDEGDGQETDGIAILSPRELEIFSLLVNGDNTKAIANRLSISPRTAETHKYNIFTKLQADNMIDLMKIAIRTGYVKL